MRTSDARRAVWVTILLTFGTFLMASAWLAWALPSAPDSRVLSPLARTPTPLPTAAVPGNLAANPSFEGDYVLWQGSISVASGWKPWYLAVPPCLPWKPNCYIPYPSNCVGGHDYGCFWAVPEYGSVLYSEYDYRVHTGVEAQKYFTYGRMHEGGLYQQIGGIVPGSLVEFSAWIQTWMCFNYDDCNDGRTSDQPSDMHIRVGIDPTGGTVPTSTNIIWSPEVPAFDQWTLFSVRARAQSSTVTVFTHSRPEWDYARANNDVYLDDASLVVVAPPASFAIQPPQPELGQVTTVQVQANDAYANTVLAITDPNSVPIAPVGGIMSGSGPFVWTWQFTPTVPGTHTLSFSANTLPVPVTSIVRAVAAVRLTVQPLTALLSQTVMIRASAYYVYPSQQLTVTDPGGAAITITDEGITDAYTHTWGFASLVTGTHRITFTAGLLDAPLTANVNVSSTAIVDVFPRVPPVGTPVDIRAVAYYPYTGAAVALVDPQGQALEPDFLGRSDDTPFAWTWTFTPAITGTHILTFTANGLDAPIHRLVFAGGQAVYLPIALRQ